MRTYSVATGDNFNSSAHACLMVTYSTMLRKELKRQESNERCSLIFSQYIVCVCNISKCNVDKYLNSTIYNEETL